MNKEQHLKPSKMIDIPGGGWVKIDDDGSRTILNSDLEPIYGPTSPTITGLGSIAFTSLVDQTPLYYDGPSTAA